MTKGTVEERARKFGALVGPVLTKLAQEQPIHAPRTSAVAAVLLPMTDQIKAALAKGYRPGTIARRIKESDQLDETFAQETIRLAILRIAGLAQASHKTSHDGDQCRAQSSANRNRANATPGITTSTAAFANAVRRP